MNAYRMGQIEGLARLCEAALSVEADAVQCGDLELAASMADVAQLSAGLAFEAARVVSP